MTSREEFMRQMGILADDLQDPADVLANKSRAPAKKTSSLGVGRTAARALPEVDAAKHPYSYLPPSPKEVVPAAPAYNPPPEDDDDNYLARMRKKNAMLAQSSAAAIAKSTRMFSRMGEDAETEEVHDAIRDSIPPHDTALEQEKKKEAFLKSLGIDNIQDPGPMGDDYSIPRVRSRSGLGGSSAAKPFSRTSQDYDSYLPPQRASQEYTKNAPRNAAINSVLQEEDNLRSGGYLSYDRAGISRPKRGLGDSHGTSTTPLNGRRAAPAPDTPNTESTVSLAGTTSCARTLAEEDTWSADKLKDAGNTAFENGDFRRAVRLYTKAVDRDPSNAALYSNRSAAYLQASRQMGIDTRTMALRDAEKVIELRPDWFKGYSRKGDALFKLERYHEAIAAYELGLEYDSSNANLLHSLGEAKNAAGGIRGYRPPAAGHSWDVPAFSTSPAPRPAGNLTAFDLMDQFRSTINEATGSIALGDEYRRRELEKFRSHRHTTQSDADGARPPLADSPPRPARSNIPAEFGSDAAAAYQQSLLEEYRKKKAARMAAAGK